MTVDSDLQVFQTHRADLVALAYRMLGDAGRAEDMVQEGWLRWCDRDREREVDAPKAYLVTIVARLCLNELDAARGERRSVSQSTAPAAGGFAHRHVRDAGHYAGRSHAPAGGA